MAEQIQPKNRTFESTLYFTVSLLELIDLAMLLLSFALCDPDSQRQSNSHPCGPGQPGAQPVCEIQ